MWVNITASVIRYCLPFCQPGFRHLDIQPHAYVKTIVAMGDISGTSVIRVRLTGMRNNKFILMIFGRVGLTQELPKLLGANSVENNLLCNVMVNKYGIDLRSCLHVHDN